MCDTQRSTPMAMAAAKAKHEEAMAADAAELEQLRGRLREAVAAADGEMEEARARHKQALAAREEEMEAAAQALREEGERARAAHEAAMSEARQLSEAALEAMRTEAKAELRARWRGALTSIPKVFILVIIHCMHELQQVLLQMKGVISQIFHYKNGFI